MIKGVTYLSYLFCIDAGDDIIVDARLTELRDRLRQVETINHERELDLQDLRQQINIVLAANIGNNRFG